MIEKIRGSFAARKQAAAKGFDEIVVAIASGKEPGEADLAEALADAGKTLDDLEAAVHRRVERNAVKIELAAALKAAVPPPGAAEEIAKFVKARDAAVEKSDVQILGLQAGIGAAQKADAQAGRLRDQLLAGACGPAAEALAAARAELLAAVQARGEARKLAENVGIVHANLAATHHSAEENIRSCAPELRAERAAELAASAKRLGEVEALQEAANQRQTAAIAAEAAAVEAAIAS